MFLNTWRWIKYFILYPAIGFFPSPYPYLLSRFFSRFDYAWDATRRKSIRREIASLFDGIASKSLDLVVRRYFEVVACDEIDMFIFLSGFSKRMMNNVAIEGDENLRKVSRAGGGIFLTAHYGGGFWVLPLLRKRGFRVHFFSADIRKEDYPSRKALYLYYKWRSWVVEKASGGRVLFKGAGKNELRRILGEGGWVIVLFDVPPFLVREKMELPFLKRCAFFPKGIISIAKELDVPLAPFFSFLDEKNRRRICFEEPFYVTNVDESVKKCASLIERRILERPDHWHFWPIGDQFFSLRHEPDNF